MGGTHDRIVNEIIARIERGVDQWHKPWNGQPRNLISRKRYQGVNMRSLTAQEYAQPWWLTSRQARHLGGRIREGEHGIPVIYYQRGVQSRLVRVYTVFNVAQCEGIQPPPDAPQGRPDLDAILERTPQPPRLVHGGANPIYHSETDTITMPRATDFDSTIAYYAALYHELVHSTGHKTRLNRRSIMRHPGFGTPVYVREDLTAELGAAFLCAHAGISSVTLDDSAAYIAQWLDAPSKQTPLLLKAKSDAQHATDYILGGEPRPKATKYT
ncbi:MAG TPA: zincin-like metallopeptidase domain-containing protein [Thermoanaerobaculales bacterium]|nr:zincin-like metallopeptidase domain-containing protein [Thermoanaerobaculales bacterium]HQP36287.1 zincin-like metallopeptidase domain-containing protein [Polyangiaceae bacterium]